MNNTKHILSIITICYNEKQIERTCKSILEQTWQDFEWIVIDGGSTDGTLDILKKYQNRINILISESDKGIYNAMNKGINLATGKYLNFMNGGDAFYNKNVLEKVFKNKSYHADILYGMSFFTHSKLSSVKTYPPKLKINFFRDNCINHQACFIKRTLFQQYGLYNENYKLVADYEKWLVFFKSNCSFEYIPNTVALYDVSGMSSINWVKTTLEHIQAYKSILTPVRKYEISFLKYFHFKYNTVLHKEIFKNNHNI